MSSVRINHVALYLAPEDPYAGFTREAIEHAGLLFTEIPAGDLPAFDESDVFVLCGRAEFPEALRPRLRRWIENGGALVCVGSTWGLDDILGIQAALPGRQPHNEMVAAPKGSESIWPEGATHTRFFGGAYVQAIAARCRLFTASRTACLTDIAVGSGVAFFLAPHIGQSLALMQMGHAVEGEMVGSADGSVGRNDGIGRSEDGINLSLEKDRFRPENSPAAFFTLPHADVLRELLVRIILEAGEAIGGRMALTWHWPNDAQGAICYSVSCDEFNGDHPLALQKAMAGLGIRAAFLVAPPGYTLDIYRTLKNWGHEIGLLYAPDEANHWIEEKLKIQLVTLGRSCGNPALATSRPAGAKWKGLTTFYDFAESAGIRISLSKGGVQAGTQGFAFGGSQPFYPIRRDQQPYRCLEIPFTILQPGLICSEIAAEHVLEEVQRRSGCAHVALRVDAMTNSAISATLAQLAGRSRSHALQMMLPEEIASFERARRHLKSQTITMGKACLLTLHNEYEVSGLNILISGGRVTADGDDRIFSTGTVQRYGRAFTSVTIDLAPKSKIEIRIAESLEEVAA